MDDQLRYRYYFFGESIDSHSFVIFKYTAQTLCKHLEGENVARLAKWHFIVLSTKFSNYFFDFTQAEQCFLGRHFHKEQQKMIFMIPGIYD